MGSFSWTRADITTDRSNFTDGDMYKLLIPKEFGGGYITDIYWDYGYLFHINEENSQNDIDAPYYSLCGYTDTNGKFYSHKDFPVNDLYGILAYWNNNELLDFEGETAPKTIIEILKRGKTCDYNNRGAGIDVGCYRNQIDELKFPLKMVSMSYEGTYEDCPARSYGDPNQGFDDYYWSSYDYVELYEKLEELYRDYELKILENKGLEVIKMTYKVGDKVTFRKKDKSGNEIFVTGTIIDAPTMGNITIIEDDTKDEHWIIRDSIVGSNGWNTSNKLKTSSDLDKIKEEIAKLKASSNCDFLTHRNNNDYAVGYICALGAIESFISRLEEEK